MHGTGLQFGSLQVCVTHSRQPWRGLRVLGPAKFLGAVTMTLGTVVAALGFPLFTAVSLVGIATGRLLTAETLVEAASTGLSLTLFAGGVCAMTLPALTALRRRGWWELAPTVAALPVYYVLISWAAWRGLFEFIWAPSHWNKTDHGVARTSRLGTLKRLSGDPWRLLRARGRP